MECNLGRYSRVTESELVGLSNNCRYNYVLMQSNYWIPEGENIR